MPKRPTIAERTLLTQIDRIGNDIGVIVHEMQLMMKAKGTLYDQLSAMQNELQRIRQSKPNAKP